MIFLGLKIFKFYQNFSLKLKIYFLASFHTIRFFLKKKLAMANKKKTTTKNIAPLPPKKKIWKGCCLIYFIPSFDIDLQPKKMAMMLMWIVLLVKLTIRKTNICHLPRLSYQAKANIPDKLALLVHKSAFLANITMRKSVNHEKYKQSWANAKYI